MNEREKIECCDCGKISIIKPHPGLGGFCCPKCLSSSTKIINGIK